MEKGFCLGLKREQRPQFSKLFQKSAEKVRKNLNLSMRYNVFRSQIRKCSQLCKVSKAAVSLYLFRLFVRLRYIDVN